MALNSSKLIELKVLHELLDVIRFRIIKLKDSNGGFWFNTDLGPI
jgi:hypothetical protein